MLMSVFAVILEMSVVLSGVQPAPLADPLPPGARVRFGTARFTHYGPISWLGFANDKLVITATREDGLRFWDVAGGKEIARYDCVFPRYSFALSGAGQRLAFRIYDDKDMKIIDPASKKELRRFTLDDLLGPEGKRFYSHRFALSREGRFLAVWEDAPLNAGFQAEALKRRRFAVDVWDLDAGRRVHEIKGCDIREVEFSPDGKTFIAQEQGKENSLRSWDVGSGKEGPRAELPRSLFRFLFLPDGKTLLGLSKERDELHLYDAATGKELRAIGDKGQILTFALSRDGKNLAMVQGGRLFVQGLESGKVAISVPLHVDLTAIFGSNEQIIDLVAFSPDGKTLAVASGRYVELWNLTTAARIHPVETIGGPVMAVNAHGRQLLVRGKGGNLSHWDLRTGKLIRRFLSEPGVRPPLLEPGFSLFGVANLERLNSAGNLQAISPDGTKIAAVWHERPIHLFNSGDGKLLRRLEGSDRATSLAFSPDGKYLAGNNMQDGRICLWETTTGKPTQFFTPPVDEPGQNGPPAALALRFSANGKRLAASTWIHYEASDFLDWELATGNLRSPVKSERRAGYQMGHDDTDNKTLAFITAPDGKYIAVAAQRSIRILDFLTGKEVRRFGGRDVVGQSAVFSPDGKYFVAGLDNGGIRFWNAATGTVLHDVPAHSATITSLAFADEGKTLVSGSLDGTAIAWDLDHLLKKPTADRAGLEPLWTALGQVDGEKAAQAMQALANRPKETPTFFRARLQPAPVADPKRLRQRLTDLQSNQFAVRQQANDELEKLGGQVRAALEAELRAGLAIEGRRRIEALLQKLEPPFSDPEILRTIRAIEVLERIGNADARALLESLAAGGPGHRLTDDAREALDRLTKRP